MSHIFLAFVLVELWGVAWFRLLCPQLFHFNLMATPFTKGNHSEKPHHGQHEKRQYHCDD